MRKRFENILEDKQIFQMMRVSRIILFLTIMLSLILTGCGVAGDGSNGDLDRPGMNEAGAAAIVQTQPEDVTHMVEPDRSLFVGEKLTIVARGAYELRSAALKYMNDNPGVTVEIIDLWDDSWFDFTGMTEQGRVNEERAIEGVHVQLMAGSAPVLLAGIIDPNDPRMVPYMTDWFPVMKADPDFNEDDWFMNVFHTVAVDGKLYNFPTRFHYEIAAVNSMIPGLRERLSGRSGVTLQELLELHREFAGDSDMLFSKEFDVSWMIRHDLDEFIDVEAGRVDINNEKFIDLIKYYKELTSSDNLFGLTAQGFEILPSFEQLSSTRYLYTVVGLHTPQYIVDFARGPIFLEHLPFVDERGELLISTFSNFVLNANATHIEQALAWDFIKFTNDPDNAPGEVYMQPTNKGLSRIVSAKHIRQAIHTMTQFHWETAGTGDEAVERAVALTEMFGDMPMRSIWSDIPRLVYGLIWDALELFNDGLVSAEQTAADLQNQVELLLMEMGRR